MTKYELDPKFYAQEENSKALSDKMEELAAAYIEERGLSYEVDDLWNDGTAEAVRGALDYGLEHNEGFFAADAFYDEILN